MKSIDTVNTALRLSVKRAIIIKIETKEWDMSKPIPSSNELVNWLGIKRHVVDHVLKELILKGILGRKKGHSIFILQQNVCVNDL